MLLVVVLRACKLLSSADTKHQCIVHEQRSAQPREEESARASTSKREEVSDPLDPRTLKRQLQEKLGKARAGEERAIREELQRLTTDASAKRMQLMAKESLSMAAA